MTFIRVPDIIAIASNSEKDFAPFRLNEPIGYNADEEIMRDLAAVFEEAEVQEEICSSMDVSERIKTPLRMKMYLGLKNGWKVYRFEAEKHYNQKGNTGCKAVPHMSGWIVYRPDGSSLIIRDYPSLNVPRPKGDSTYPIINPLGIYVDADRVFVLAQLNGYESVRYTILEIVNSQARDVLN